MSTTTSTPTTRQLANRLLSTLDWLAGHQEALPGGWVMRSYPDNGPNELVWTPTFNTEDDLLAVLTYLRDRLGPGEGKQSRLGVTWVAWSAEGDRPRLVVHMTDGAA